MYNKNEKTIREIVQYSLLHAFLLYEMNSYIRLLYYES